MTIDIAAVSKMIECLSGGGTMTLPQLMKETGMGRTAVARWIKSWHKRKPKLIYICGWIKSGLQNVAVYTMGYDCCDVPRPKQKTRKEIDRDRNARVRSPANPERVAERRRADCIGRPRDAKGRLVARSAQAPLVDGV